MLPDPPLPKATYTGFSAHLPEPANVYTCCSQSMLKWLKVSCMIIKGARRMFVHPLLTSWFVVLFMPLQNNPTFCRLELDLNWMLQFRSVYIYNMLTPNGHLGFTLSNTTLGAMLLWMVHWITSFRRVIEPPDSLSADCSLGLQVFGLILDVFHLIIDYINLLCTQYPQTHNAFFALLQKDLLAKCSYISRAK